MTFFTLNIDAPTKPLESRSQELAYITQAVATAMMEFNRNHELNGNIIGQAPDGVPNSSLGSWTYTPAAAKP